MDIISDPHDAYFKSTFGQIEMAKDFIDNYLPEGLKKIINTDTLSHEPNSFLNKELKNQFADLVYKAEIKGKKAYISFLFEHKSYKDRMVIFQILKYMVSIWENKIKNDIEKAKAEGRELKAEEIEIPIVLPIVVYHDKYEWNIRRTLGEMMPGYINLPENIKKYIPNYEYLLADITKPDDKINLNEEHAIVLETLSKVRYESKEEIIEIFKKAIKIYIKSKDKDMVRYFIIKTIVYIISSRDDFDEKELKEIANQISEEGGELFMTLAKRLMEKGRLEGVEKGMEKGIEKGMEKGETKALARTAIKLLTRKFDSIPEDLKQGITGLDAPTLEVIIDNIFEYNSPDDVKKYIR